MTTGVKKVSTLATSHRRSGPQNGVFVVCDELTVHPDGTMEGISFVFHNFHKIHIWMTAKPKSKPVFMLTYGDSERGLQTNHLGTGLEAWLQYYAAIDVSYTVYAVMVYMIYMACQRERGA